ncbi:MAG TPA: CoA-binding protein [Candidatus Acidoferrales bacterium]|nr:CoA-binding protein [Candidatus Acidoferrales bacterium]
MASASDERCSGKGRLRALRSRSDHADPQGGSQHCRRRPFVEALPSELWRRGVPAGYRIIPVNPHEQEVLGQKSYPRLEEVPDKVDIVNVFRRSEHVPEVVEDAIRIGAKAVWMQEGVIHSQAAERARQAGLLVVMDTCILKEHIRRFRLGRT